MEESITTLVLSLSGNELNRIRVVLKGREEKEAADVRMWPDPEQLSALDPRAYRDRKEPAVLRAEG